MTTSTLSIGSFSYTSAVPRWTWSDAMFALHGMAPGDVVPTRALFLSHVHPEDRERVGEVLDDADGQPHGCAYHLVDLSGQVRQVLITVASVPGTETVTGFVVDDSVRERQAVSAEVNTELQIALESHAAIDQAKGMLMLVYGVDSDAAFELLRWASQQRNVRLRVLADRLVQAVLSVGGVGPKARGAVDELFIAAIDDIRLPAREPRGRQRTLEIQLDPPGAAAPVLRVSGRVDVTAMAELAAALGALMVAGRETGRVVVDLSGVEDAGAVLRFLVQSAQRRCAARDIAVDVVGAAGETVGAGLSARARQPLEHSRQTVATHP
ncbi:PAS and ANTAR domain-containing protein [Cellulomonas sp. P5_C6]